MKTLVAVAFLLVTNVAAAAQAPSGDCSMEVLRGPYNGRYVDYSWFEALLEGKGFEILERDVVRPRGRYIFSTSLENGWEPGAGGLENCEATVEIFERAKERAPVLSWDYPGGYELGGSYKLTQGYALAPVAQVTRKYAARRESQNFAVCEPALKAALKELPSCVK